MAWEPYIFDHVKSSQPIKNRYIFYAGYNLYYIKQQTLRLFVSSKDKSFIKLLTHFIKNHHFQNSSLSIHTKVFTIFLFHEKIIFANWMTFSIILIGQVNWNTWNKEQFKNIFLNSAEVGERERGRGRAVK